MQYKVFYCSAYPSETKKGELVTNETFSSVEEAESYVRSRQDIDNDCWWMVIPCSTL